MYNPAVGDMIYYGPVCLVVDEVGEKSVVLRLFTQGKVYDPAIKSKAEIIALVDSGEMSVITKPSPVLET